jgi:hypothetical protein
MALKAPGKDYSKDQSKDRAALVLPTVVVSRLDVARLSRELEGVNDYLEQHELHAKKGEAPRLGAMLAEVAQTNKLDLLQADDRRQLVKFLEGLKKQAPTIHMSFAAPAPVPFVQKIIEWLRKEVHPLILLDVGLQPAIAAGCVIRTTNKYFDCSMGQHLRKNRATLVQALNTAPPKAAAGVAQ